MLRLSAWLRLVGSPVVGDKRRNDVSDTADDLFYL